MMIDQSKIDFIYLEPLGLNAEQSAHQVFPNLFKGKYKSQSVYMYVTMSVSVE